MTRSGNPTVLFTLLVLLGVAPVTSAHYETTTGRWIERDPAGYVDGANLYLAYRGSPINYGDYDGLDTIDPSLPVINPSIKPQIPEEAPAGGTPEGIEVPGSGGRYGNCLGIAVGSPKYQYLNWKPVGDQEIDKNALPHLANQDLCPPDMWTKIKKHVPTGCREVNCDEMDSQNTPCDCDGGDSLDLIVWVWREWDDAKTFSNYQWRQDPFDPENRWPERIPGSYHGVKKQSRCFYHAVERNPCESSGFDSKIGEHVKVCGITDPDSHLKKYYARALGGDSNVANHELVKRCFACDRGAMKGTDPLKPDSDPVPLF